MSINNCQFTHNKFREGHGAGIYYTSNHEQSAQLVINNCNFILNKPAKSVVYIDNSNYKINGHTSLLQNSTFTQNKGVPFYVSHSNLILCKVVSFKYNKAIDGGAIYSSNSVIKFDDNCNVSFYNNVANNGGAIYQTHSMMFFRDNAAVMFTSNRAANGAGGAIYQTSSKIFFTMSKKVLFTRNVAKSPFNHHQRTGSSGVGGAVYSKGYSPISFEDQSVVIFNGNRADFEGGALLVLDYSNITVHGNSKISFTNNRVGDKGYNAGGALVSKSYCNLSFGGNSTVTFNENSAAGLGGAVVAIKSNITFHGQYTATFSRNHARESGGALAIAETVLSFSKNSIVKFTDNRVYTKYFFNVGGAVFFDYSSIIFDGHSMMIFSRNHAVSDGRREEGSITITNQGEGGAISTTGSSSIFF